MLPMVSNSSVVVSPVSLTPVSDAKDFSSIVLSEALEKETLLVALAGRDAGASVTDDFPLQCLFSHFTKC